MVEIIKAVVLLVVAIPLPDTESRADEISKCKKHTILVDNYGYLYL